MCSVANYGALVIAGIYRWLCQWFGALLPISDRFLTDFWPISDRVCCWIWHALHAMANRCRPVPRNRQGLPKDMMKASGKWHLAPGGRFKVAPCSNYWISIHPFTALGCYWRTPWWRHDPLRAPIGGHRWWRNPHVTSLMPAATNNETPPYTYSIISIIFYRAANYTYYTWEFAYCTITAEAVEILFLRRSARSAWRVGVTLRGATRRSMRET